MSSDRGTVQRSPVTGTGPQTGWQAPTTPAGRRLPTAPRERKPVLAALAVLLILGGALGAGYLVTTSSKQVQAIEITRQIGAGQRIPLSAMQQVPVPAGTQVGYVAWVYASQVTRYYAAVTIPPGTLLNKSMVATTNRSTAGREVIGLALKDGQLPRGLQAGDHVDIFFVQNSTQVNGCPGTPGSLLSGNAIVLGLTAPSVTAGSQDADVQVAVSPADAGAVACAAANGIAGLTVRPPGAHAGPEGGTGAGAGAGGRPNQGPGAGSGTVPGGSPSPSVPVSPSPSASASVPASASPSPSGSRSKAG
jgi:hypothetical protein